MLKPVVSTSALRKQSGAAILWMMLWLAGIVAITYICLIKHLPALELATEKRIGTALAATTATGVVASVNGYAATLIGTAKTEADKNEWLSLAAATTGVREVVDQIDIEGASSDALAVAKADDSTPLIAPTAQTQEDDTPSGEKTDAELAQMESSIDQAQPGSATTDQDTDSSTAETPTPTGSDQGSPIQEPALEIEVADGTLMLAGRVADADAINPLVEQAKETLGVDFVIDSIDIDPNTAPATWIEPLTALLPAMSPLSSPAFDVKKDQITLSGDAPSQQAHDEVINRALSLLGDYSLVERINVVPAPAEAKPVEEPEPAETADATTEQVTDVTQASKSNYATENTPTVEPPTTDESASSDTNNSETADAKADNNSTDNAANSEAATSAASASTTEDSGTSVTPQVKVDEPGQVKAQESVKPTELASVATQDNDNTATENNTGNTDTTPVDTKEDQPAAVRAAFEALPSKRILFKSSSTILTAESKQVLNKIAEILNTYSDAKMDINGHTDASGKADINLLLSQERANAVRDYLVSQGISIYRLTAYGYGEGLPIAPNNTPEGRALNRRIEFKF